MNRFDKFLKILFSRKAILIFLGVLICGMFSGCIVTDNLACMSESCGSRSCAERLNRCDSEIFSCFYREDCKDEGYNSYIGNLFGSGCELEACNSVLLSWGGCNRSCFTDCGAGCGGPVSNCGNLYCYPLEYKSSINKTTIEVTYPYPVPYSEFIEVNRRTFGSKLDLPTPQSEYAQYFEVSGFVNVAVDGDTQYAGYRVLEADGTVVNRNIIASAGSELTFSAQLEEKRLGDKIVIEFTSSYKDLVLNSIQAIVGDPITTFRHPELDGYEFLGWRAAGTNNEPIMFEDGDTFHLYTFNAGVGDVIILEPVFILR